MESQESKQKQSKQDKLFLNDDPKDEIVDSKSNSMVTTLIDRKEVSEEYFDFNAIDAIIDNYFQILRGIQNKYSYLENEDIKEVTIALNKSLSRVYPLLDSIDESILERILFAKEGKATNLIPILQSVQDHFRFLSKITMKRIAEYLELSINEVYSVASFYTQFKYERPGKHQITLCSGTACFVKGGSVLLDAVEKHLKIVSGETTEDRFFTLETVSCLGCCALSPAVIIDDEIHGHMKPSKLIKLLNKTKKGGI